MSGPLGCKCLECRTESAPGSLSAKRPRLVDEALGNVVPEPGEPSLMDMPPEKSRRLEAGQPSCMRRPGTLAKDEHGEAASTASASLSNAHEPSAMFKRFSMPEALSDLECNLAHVEKYGLRDALKGTLEARIPDIPEERVWTHSFACGFA